MPTRRRATGPGSLARAESALRGFALDHPEVTEEFPWGHRAMKVKGKAFVFIALESERLSLSVKLPATGISALMLPFAAPTAYGLGKSGWVTASFAAGDQVPLELLREWIDESYRAIAPKRLIAASRPSTNAPGRTRAARRKTARR